MRNKQKKRMNNKLKDKKHHRNNPKPKQNVVRMNKIPKMVANVYKTLPEIQKMNVQKSKIVHTWKNILMFNFNNVNANNNLYELDIYVFNVVG